jgi:hypothetical protein
MEPLQQEKKSENLVKEIIALQLINSYRFFTVINHISHMTQAVISSCPTAQQLSQQKYPIRNCISCKLQSTFCFLHFYRTVYNFEPPASKQVLRILEIVLNTQWSLFLEISLRHMHSHTLSHTCICMHSKHACMHAKAHAHAHTYKFCLLIINGKIIKNAYHILQFCVAGTLYIF